MKFVFFLQENEIILWGHTFSAMLRGEPLSCYQDDITPAYCTDRCDWLMSALFYTFTLSTYATTVYCPKQQQDRNMFNVPMV